MVTPTLLERIHACEDGYDVLYLDPDADHSCPCFYVEQGDMGLDGSCWRRGHGYCVIRFKNVPAREQAIVHFLLSEMDWYGTWVVEPWKE